MLLLETFQSLGLGRFSPKRHNLNNFVEVHKKMPNAKYLSSRGYALIEKHFLRFPYMFERYLRQSVVYFSTENPLTHTAGQFSTIGHNLNSFLEERLSYTIY